MKFIRYVQIYIKKHLNKNFIRLICYYFQINILLAITFIFVGDSHVNADYKPNEKTKVFVEQIKKMIEVDAKNEKNKKLAIVEWFYAFEKTKNNTKLSNKADYIIQNIQNYLREKIKTAKQNVKDKEREKKFFDKYSAKITTQNKEVTDLCYKKFKVVDDFARAFEMPTPLILWTRKMETSCRLSYYKNGPFQIISYNYKNYSPTINNFIQHLYDYEKFIKSKFDRYKRVNNNDNAIKLSYNKRSYNDLIKYAALYNWLQDGRIKSPIYPSQEKYFFGNYSNDFVSKKDWLFVVFLKILRKKNEFSW